jgi:hypothetical protein
MKFNAIKMGHDIYFFDPETSDRTAAIQVSYSFNCFYSAFNPTVHDKKKARDVIEPLKAAIAYMLRAYPLQQESKDPLKAVPGNYVQFLKLMLSYATKHPDWNFYCD